MKEDDEAFKVSVKDSLDALETRMVEKVQTMTHTVSDLESKIATATKTAQPSVKAPEGPAISAMTDSFEKAGVLVSQKGVPINEHGEFSPGGRPFASSPLEDFGGVEFIDLAELLVIMSGVAIFLRLGGIIFLLLKEYRMEHPDYFKIGYLESTLRSILYTLIVGTPICLTVSSLIPQFLWGHLPIVTICALLS